jgi:hypothetical protein
MSTMVCYDAIIHLDIVCAKRLALGFTHNEGLSLMKVNNGIASFLLQA